MKIYTLDPRHKHLLTDNWSGYLWLKPTLSNIKYRGKVVFTPNLGESINNGLIQKASARRNRRWLMNTSWMKVGYIYSTTDFIKLYPTSEPSIEAMEEAMSMRRSMIIELRATAKREGLIKKYGKNHGSRRIAKQPGSRSSDVWVWGFKNESLGLEFPHIFSSVETSFEEEYKIKKTGRKRDRVSQRVIIRRTRVGKTRREFCEWYGLGYQSMRALADGRIDIHKGWVRISPPRKITLDEAIAMKWQLEKQREVSDGQ